MSEVPLYPNGSTMISMGKILGPRIRVLVLGNKIWRTGRNV